MGALILHIARAAFLMLGLINAQTVPGVQTSTFNSSAKLSPGEIRAAELDSATARATEIGLNFERSNWAGDSVALQDFYAVPAEASTLRPGSLIKKEDYTSTALYTVPPNVALSRILFQSETVNGTSVPASAFVLWPYTARRFKQVDGVPVVAWAHGNSGWNSECAPSHIRNLWYQFSAPFELALSGYAVVAPDYTGLGVGKDADGKRIHHQFFANSASGNDLMHAVQAARDAWPMLSKEFVVMGHSQGGGAAWGAAQRQAERPVAGYLGTIAGSPVTSIRGLEGSVDGVGNVVGPGLAQHLRTIFPSFRRSDLLNELGLKRLNLLSKLRGCNSVTAALFNAKLYKQGWQDTWYVRAFDKLTSNGGKKYQGPLLVLQGDADGTIVESVTSEAVRKTCERFPKQHLHYAVFNGATHVPVLYASRMMWMDWIADRFKGVSLPHGCSNETIAPVRNVDTYQKEIGYFLEWAKYYYEVA